MRQTLVDVALVQWCRSDQHGNILFFELNIEDSSGFRNFVRATKSDFEILLQKIGPRIQRKGTKFGEEIPASIRAAVTLRYQASSDFISTSVVLIPFILARKSIAFLCHYGFCTICTMHITQNMHWTANHQLFLSTICQPLKFCKQTKGTLKRTSVFADCKRRCLDLQTLSAVFHISWYTIVVIRVQIIICLRTVRSQCAYNVRRWCGQGSIMVTQPVA